MLVGNKYVVNMSEAYQCDICQKIKDGKPYGILKLRKRGGGIDSELCESCYNMMADQIE
jgi:NMD protein affecting ribosome stability and mRNA decay